MQGSVGTVALRLRFGIPRFLTSTVESAAPRAKPILDGREGTVANVWKLPPHTVALVGRPAVWFALDLTTPRIPLGFATLPALRHVWEQDFGGHLFLAITGDDPSHVFVVEGGPADRDGTGALVPFCYPEDDFAKRGINDFDPVVIDPPHGLSNEFFAHLVRQTQRTYDGDQRYLAIEIPFLRVGRDSNSYAIGVLLASGVDGRLIPKPVESMRWEYSGYPGAGDPVHRANFGAYLGEPSDLGNGASDLGIHAADGQLVLSVVGGSPSGTARLPDGSDVRLDALGRITFSPEDARRHGLPTKHTEPPEQIRHRRHFPSDPAPAGAMITLVVNGSSVPLEPGTERRGVIVERNDALNIAKLRTYDGGTTILPLAELGVEMRDPKRVDRLFQVGNEVTVGLHHDRRPKLIAHGKAAADDVLRWHQFHSPPWRYVAISGTLGLVALALGVGWWRNR
jgi:hypothetical protein